MKIRFVPAAAIGFTLLLLQCFAAEAAEVKVISGVAMRAVWEELGPQFERTSGHKVTIWYGDRTSIRQRIDVGEAFDLAVFGKAGLDMYIKKGMIAAGTRTEIARVGMGVGTRTGAPKPDIGSVDAFKRALLDAKSVSYNPKGAVGLHLANVFERLGIGEQMKAKNKWRRQQSGRSYTAQAMANGEAELGFTFSNEILLARGVEFVGFFPTELQRYNLFTAGVATSAKQPEAAKALIKFLGSPAAAAVIKAKGMEPVSQ